MAYERPRFLSAGDRALCIEFGNAISPELSLRVRRTALAIEKAGTPGIAEVVPTYRSLLVYYDPLIISLGELKERVTALERDVSEDELPQPVVTEIPVAYGGEFGPDLEFVAAHSGLTPEEVVRLHSGATYLIYMLGFIPGYTYLGGMSPRLATPRLKTPRTRVPAGTVGIGGIQTGIYAVESPGGWQIIGRTPLRLFDPGREPPALLRAGNYVRFIRVTPQEFARIAAEVARGTYQVEERPLRTEEKSGGV